MLWYGLEAELLARHTPIHETTTMVVWLIDFLVQLGAGYYQEGGGPDDR